MLDGGDEAGVVHAGDHEEVVDAADAAGFHDHEFDRFKDLLRFVDMGEDVR